MARLLDESAGGLTDARIVLHRESRLAVYDDAAQMLHDFGIRWHASEELGEVVPARRTLAVTVGRRA